MTAEDSALWLMLLIGGLAGWWWRGRCERKATVKHNSPEWIGLLGKSVVKQITAVEANYRFTGDDVEISSEQTYVGGGKSYLVSVRRKQHVTVDQ